MKRFLLPLATPLLVGPLAGCVVHFHIHEAPRPGTAAETPAETPTETATETAAHATPAPVAKATETAQQPEAVQSAVTGLVVDESGKPLRARVAAIGTSGSVANATNAEGRFELGGLRWSEFTLHASTEDDLVAIATGVSGNSKDVKLVARPAAAVTVTLADEKSSRCAFFRDGARIEDFTLRPGKPSRVVLPSGDVHVRLYEGEEIRAEHDLHLAVGQHLDLELASATKTR